MFRMVAIAALGDIGAAEDRDLLTALAAEDNPRIQDTATKALEQFDDR